MPGCYYGSNHAGLMSSEIGMGFLLPFGGFRLLSP